MINGKPDHNEGIGLPAEEDMVEDSFLSETLSGLSSVQVPSNFLPGVMHRVYEKHYRDKLPLGFILGAGSVLLISCLIFFALDVSDYGHRRGLSGFAEAMDHKVGLLSDHCSGVVEGVGDLFSATWQIVSGAAGTFSVGALIGLFLAFAVLLYLIKRGLAALMGS